MIRKFRRYISGALVFLMLHANAYAAATDLASSPLVTSPSSSILPNLLFAFDDSGSMAWYHMPDDSSDAGSSVVWQYGWFGGRSSQCNGMYYNPAITYSPPVDATGASYANATYTAAWNDGFKTSSGTTDLSSGFSGIPSADSALTADGTATAGYYYKYNGAQTTAQKNYNSTTSTFATECGSSRSNSSEPSIPTGTLAAGGTGALWTRVNVSSNSTIASYSRSPTTNSPCTVTATTAAGGTTGMTAGMAITVVGLNNSTLNGARTVLAVVSSTQFTYSVGSNCGTTTASGGGNVLFNVVPSGHTDERQNFANWYSYYRTRIQMMKTAMGLAVKPITNQYRVGFLSMNQQSESLNVATFDSTQKTAFYNLLYSKTVGSGTPLRTLLSQAGKYYANKLTVSGFTTTDPMQYSCQQNFTILSTDGFWNAGNGSKLDGTTMDNEDGLEARPFNDGSNNVVTAVTPSVTTVRQSSAQVQTTTIPWTETQVTSAGTLGSCTISSSGKSSAPNTCLQDGSTGPNSISSQRTWCVGTAAAPGNSNDCSGPFGSGNPQVYVCRGISVATAVPDAPDNLGCQSDGSGQLYCLFNTSSGSNGCTPVYSGSPIRICRASGTVNGYKIISKPLTYNEVQHLTTTTLQDVATTTNTTVVTTNGVSAPPTTSSGGSTTTVISTSANVASDTGAPTGGTTFTSGSSTTTCSLTPGTTGTSAAVAGTASTVNNGSATVTTVSTSGPVVGTTVTTSPSPTGGSSNTLSDVAEYYYVTDLRDASLSNCTGAPIPPATSGIDVCTNNVPVSGQDTASTQHMTTFTLALGARGNMLYSPTYLTDKTGDFFDVKNGTTANSAGGICSWQTSGACNWPAPGQVSGGDGLLANIDDTWHAAVNGRGQYFSATDPSTLTLGLSTALAGVKTRTGSSAAATTSNPNVTSGDNFVFSSTFTTTEWDGELVRQQLDLTTGAVSNTIDWTAQTQLDNNASRVIYTFDATNATTHLKSFAYASLNSSEQGYFNASNISSLSQFCSGGIAPCLQDAATIAAAAGAPLVSFLAGDRSNEGALSSNAKYYRQRIHLLGDVVDAEAVYVKAPLLNFSDAGFSSFASTNATRQGMVYVASNDGMLHAFYAGTGTGSGTGGAEAWAYVPTLLFPNLYKLADKSYASNHQYFSDGTPIVGDVYFSSAWHTILVAGLGGGGKGYYALDITDPANPKALWEFTDTNMGYTYGNPVIAKLKDGTATNGSGTWAVFLTSGYNNNGSGQDGQGHLYVVNAGTGAKIRDISTGVGSNASPSGLARINAWVDNTSVDNTALRVYGGDMLGNLWRFDVNNLYGTAGYDAQKLITVYANTAGTTTQPITVKPELGLVNNTPVVYFGTGRFLGLTDLADTTQQSFYAVQDKLDATTLTTPRGTGTKFVQQTLTTTTCPANSPATICGVGQIVRTSTSTPVTFPTNDGWFMDLPDSGERDNTDPTLALGTIGFTTNVPSTNACTAGGTSFRYLLDYATGAPVSTSTTHVSGIQLGSALATRAVFVRLPNNTVVQLTRMSDGTTLTTNVPIGGSASSVRRVSWRELITDQ